jgi:RHS repeat-associated protein
MPDALGSVTAVTDGAGVATQINRYDEYGVPQAGFSGRFGYAGSMYLNRAMAAPWNMRNRQYNPSLGRFLQTDPIGIAGGVNLYAYVGGDPVNAVDPWGLQDCAPGPDEACAPYETGWLLCSTVSIPGRPDLGSETTCRPEIGWYAVSITGFSPGNVGGMEGWQLFRTGGGGGGGGMQDAREIRCILERPAGRFTVGPNAVPYFQPDFARTLGAAFVELNEMGVTPYITSGYRDEAAQARMRAGGSGRNPAALVSLHQQGIAVDLDTLGGRFVDIRTVMQAHGFVWGGTFRTRDRPHFQLVPPGTPADRAVVADCEAGYLRGRAP